MKTKKFILSLFLWFCLFGAALAQETVKIWQEPLTIPTYLVDAPDKNPMFFQHQSYQGASRVIYPYALNDNITDKKEDRTYKALYLENEYIKLCVLPEMGGRLFYAIDKTNGYDIFYHQHVIKPANIGMTGAWISGGIEFCVFHHHRASTFLPVDYTLTKNDDGSATIWIGETEPRQRMKWTIGISLYPGKSYLEVDGRLINCTENTNSFLYWANVATHVNDNYQVIFPPTTNFAMFHAKNSFSHWPVTKEVYNHKEYYKDGVDASWWKNHPEAVSFFAYDIKEGFLAGYDYGKDAGTMHVCNPHIVKGAKLWEWGPGPQGSMWDTKVLTDNDGPYAELMAGAYSDNQPDYSWMKPYELKRFHQYWYPLRETGGAKAANLNGMLNLKKISGNEYLVAANATSQLENAKIRLENNGKPVFEKVISISPGKPFHQNITLNENVNETDLHLALLNSANQVLVEYQPVKKQEKLPLPEAVQSPAKPEDIATTEELYLTGLRIKQFHNAIIDPVIYFQEALKRDPLDVRSNTQMGIICKEQGNYKEAANYLRSALKRLAKDYTNPRNCEAFYELGLVLEAQGNLDAAYDTLYRAVWDQSFASAGYFHLAEISCTRKNWDRALEEINRSIANNGVNLNALNLKTTILRKTGQLNDAKQIAADVLKADILNFWAQNELAQLFGGQEQNAKLRQLMRDQPESYLELAVGYLNAGFPDEAQSVLERAVQSDNKKLADYPTISYYLGYIVHLNNNQEKAKEWFNAAKALSTDYCFPYRLESEKVYQTALDYNPGDAKANYYLGNLLYDKQPLRAISYWEQAVKNNPEFAIAWRNLGWGYNQTLNDDTKAIAAYEKAIQNDKTQAKYYFELDQLYEKSGADLDKRYRLLTENHRYVSQRNDALLQEIKVLMGKQKYEKALDYLTNTFFYRQEGMDNLHGIYADACMLKGVGDYYSGKTKAALTDFLKADEYPENQQIGRDENYDRNAQIYYFTGLAYEKLGEKKKANQFFTRASKAEVRNPEYLYYAAMAASQLGEKEKAKELLTRVKKAAEERLSRSEDVDFFSKFGGSQSDNLRQATAYFWLGLAETGNGNQGNAKAHFQKAVELNPNHLWAKQFLIISD